MDLITDVSQYIEAKVNEEIKKSQVLTAQLLENHFIVGAGCLITGSHAKRFYGFELPHEPKDKDLLLINGEYGGYKDLYLLADSLLPKQCREGSFMSIPVDKQDELAYNKPIASFVWGNQFIEIFDNVRGIKQPYNHYTLPAIQYVPLIELVKCAQEWMRPKDIEFLSQVQERANELLKYSQH